jgi:serine/threonine protein kinase
VSDAGQTEPPPLKAGTELAPGYEVRFHFARSRELDVYDVWSAERDTHCVAKTLRPDRVRDTKPRRRLYREGRILLAVAHPHIVRAYELIAGPQPVLILEPLTGGSLEDALLMSGRVALPTVVELGLQLCSAMHYVHGRGLVHGDLKPANIVGDRNFSKVIDFSLARAPGRGHAGRGHISHRSRRAGRSSAPRLTSGASVRSLRSRRGQPAVCNRGRRGALPPARAPSGPVERPSATVAPVRAARRPRRGLPRARGPSPAIGRRADGPAGRDDRGGRRETSGVSSSG